MKPLQTAEVFFYSDFNSENQIKNNSKLLKQVQLKKIKMITVGKNMMMNRMMHMMMCCIYIPCCQKLKT
jgi:hypothetical protein